MSHSANEGERAAPKPLRTWTKPQTKPQTESLEENGGTPPQALGFRGLAEPDYPPPT